MNFQSEIEHPNEFLPSASVEARPNGARPPEEYIAFDAPWHAQLFAITVHLNETGRFSWTEWTKQFGEELKRSRSARPTDSSEAYYAAWLAALEKLLMRLNLSARHELDSLRESWVRAYVATPHGQPVTLDRGADSTETAP